MAYNKTVVTKNFELLMRCLDPNSAFLVRLRTIDYFAKRLVDIYKLTTANDKNDVLLRLVLDVPEGLEHLVVTGFVGSLRASGQDHVANIFHRESDKFAMSEAHHKKLSKNMPELCKFLEPRDGLVDLLVRDDIFTDSNRQSVLSKSTVVEMVREMVSLLQRKPDDAFDTLIAALKETNQTHVVYILTGSGTAPMSDDHRKMLRAATDKLCDFLDPENGVFPKLLKADVITSRDIGRIRCMTGDNLKVQELVETLVKKSDRAFDGLINALDDSGQSHVTYILTGKGDRLPLMEENRIKLTQNRSQLVKTIEPKCSGLLTALISRGIFSTYDQQRVTEIVEDTEYDRTEAILDLIARKSQWAFDQFVCALNDTNQPHVVMELVGCEVVGQVEAQSNTNQNIAHDVEGAVRQRMHETFISGETEVKRSETNETLSPNGISISSVDFGSIVVVFRCRTMQSLGNLKELYRSKKIDSLLSKEFCPQFAQLGLESLRLYSL